MWFWKKKKEEEKLPTSEEVIEAIFSIFSEEEMQSMIRKETSNGKPDPGLKQLMLSGAHALKPKYSIEKSVEIANEIAKLCRGDLLDARFYLLMEFTKQIFQL